MHTHTQTHTERERQRETETEKDRQRQSSRLLVHSPKCPQQPGLGLVKARS